MAIFSEIRKFSVHAPGSLIAINCILFIAIWTSALIIKLAGASISPANWLSLSSQGFLSMPWTLMTYMFTQYTPIHLLFNMLWLWWFGNILLLTMPQSRITAAYICGGLSGALAFIIYGFEGNYLLTGSSAAVISVMTLAAFRSPDYEMNLLLFGTVKLKWIAAISIVLIFIGSNSDNAGGTVAHAGGLLFGIICGICMRHGKDILAPLCKFKISFQKKDQRKMHKGMQRFANDCRRLDFLLDKIRVSGYDSLTDSERNELKRLSDALNNK